jgi:hypothetical protein
MDVTYAGLRVNGLHNLLDSSRRETMRQR